LLISVCIPEYNAVQYIDKNLLSILNQTYKNIEIILYDDASTDETRKRMLNYSERYPDKVFSYWSDINGGIGAAKNAALSHAKGDYFFFCDCDDYIKENCIEELVKAAIAANYPDIVIDGFTRIDVKGNLLYERRYSSKEKALQRSIPLWAKLIKRQFLTKHGILSPTGVILEDVLYQAKVIPNSPSVALINNCGYYWVDNVASASKTRIKTYPKNELENGFNYLVCNRAMPGTYKYEKEKYYAVQFSIWHLLRSGFGSDARSTVAEYKKAFSYLEKCFPGHTKIRFPKGIRPIMQIAIKVILLLHKIGLAKVFFYIYGRMNMTKLWPKL